MFDEHAELAFRILRTCLHERAFSNESLLNKLISLAFGMQAQQTLLPGTQTDVLARRVEQVGRAVRQDTVELLRRTLDFARRTGPGNRRSVTRFAVQEGLAVGVRDAPWHAEVDRLWDVLHARGRMMLGRRTAGEIAPGPPAASTDYGGLGDSGCGDSGSLQ